ncbi:tRNA (N(6)-L-threonylcarbamoyladenosine(37)-C(2))-methylthiotransferase MtaB [Treponema sp.]|uniref:tRNA (N(6)-L-threonylcarbamoyladenosine(37)-C(2))- methylthiotransferase MtaB n=1 Tax=Treponema sp. TaxID=166 RepID=UPI00298D8FA6|nr:tRNA (N(6)-L-threonylcarbamoyladenosine(37)-C(2))-methylthiotransferase MtaB [Treponema sp.]MCQ2240249.1 tRNA (N(6)-L-threonylcarbamoyladenosine(37)-C(2))-methylthiotransferase MtaB [Treponema sp.]
MKKIIHFETLGCRLNQDESEGAARCFSKAGFTSDLDPISSKTEISQDVILSIINTCTVTSKAEQKARRIIRLLLEKFPNAPLVVTGCYAELDGKEITEICPDRICILSGMKKYILSRIAEEIAGGVLDTEKNLLSKNKLQNFIDECSREEISAKLNKFTLFTPVFEKHSRSSLKIQDGCNNNCSFCRIHLARGKSVSLDVEDVIARAKEQEGHGAVEIVLTGVNLSQYAGKTSDGPLLPFGGLLKRLLAETGMKYRVSSFYPQHVTEDLCKILADDRIQPFFHLSIQSGSDRILEKMCRPYKVEHVARAVELLRKYKPGCFISCDIIAGFPGETDEDFALTEKLCDESCFSWIHAFPYSPRPGTAAKDMKPQIPERIKDERVKVLTSYAVNGKIDFIKKASGKTFNAIVENSRSKRLGFTASNVFHAVTDNYIHVEFSSEKFIPQGTVVKVCITSVLEENIRSGKEIEAAGVLV